MKIHRDIKQGTDEWRRVRLGVVTASDCDRIVTPATLKRSGQVRGYVAEIVAEALIGQPFDYTAGKWAERGQVVEAEARDYFSLMVEPVEEVGFISRDDGLVGCSPDGIAEGRFGLELKCPAAKTHVGYLLEPDALYAAYRLQVQFSLWLTRWPAWWLVSYCPSLPAVRRLVEPEATVFAALDDAVPAVLAAKAEALAKIAAMQDELPEDEDAKAAAIAFGI